MSADSHRHQTPAMAQTVFLADVVGPGFTLSLNRTRNVPFIDTGVCTPKTHFGFNESTTSNIFQITPVVFSFFFFHVEKACASW